MTAKAREGGNFREPATFETEALSILAWEFDVSEQAESDRKIKRRLRDKKLGPYDATRVNHLRALKNDIQAELRDCRVSKFYKPLEGPYAALGDWRFVPLTRQLGRRHPQVDPDAIARFLPYAIYLYYLR